MQPLGADINPEFLDSQDAKFLLDIIPVMVFRMTIPEGHYSYVSKGSELVSGYAPEEFYSNPLLISQVINQDWLPLFEQDWKDIIHGKDIHREHDFPFIAKNGEERWCHQQSVVISKADGSREIIGAVLDTTDLIKAQKRLGLFQLAMSESREGIIIRDMDLNPVYANQAYLTMTGISEADFLNLPFDQTIPTAIARRFTKEQLPLLRQGKTVTTEFQSKRNNGEHYAVRVRFDPVADLQGGGHIVAILTDITQEKLQEAALMQRYSRGQRELESALEQVRSLNRKLFRAQEDERLRLSLDLHDNVAQDLSSLKIALETLYDGLGPPDVNILDRLDAATAIVQQTISSVRQMTLGLGLPDFNLVGLASAMEEYCRIAAKHAGITFSFISTGLEAVDLGKQRNTHIYRIVQEAMANICNHSKAQSASIRLVVSHPQFIIRIEDNGIGFNVQQRIAETQNQHHFGLRGMQERARLLGGSLSIRSKPGRGAKIVVEAPLAS